SNGLGVILELEEHRGLVECETGGRNKLRARVAVCDGDPGLDPVALRAGASGNGGDAEARKFHLLPRLDAFGIGELFALFVLDHLLDEPAGFVIACAVDDVDGNRGRAYLASGESTSLACSHVHAPVLVSPCQQRHEDAVLTNAVDESLVEGHGRAHVCLHDEGRGVDVLDGSGSRCSSHDVSSFPLTFFCREGTKCRSGRTCVASTRSAAAERISGARRGSVSDRAPENLGGAGPAVRGLRGEWPTVDCRRL